MNEAIPSGNPPGEAAIRAAIEGYAAAWLRGDRAAIAACYHPEFTLHYFGRNPLAGDHIGKPAALAALAAFAHRTDRRLIAILATMIGATRGAILVRERLGRDEAAVVEVERLLVYAVADGLLRECWVHDQDQRRIDDIIVNATHPEEQPMEIVIEANAVDAPVIVMSCRLEAPPERVWRAFTEPRHVAQWFGGHGFSNPVCEMDVRPGGLWHHVMRTPDGQEFAIDSVFLAVAAPEQIAWRNASAGPKVVNTVTFAKDGAGTQWRLVVSFESIAARDAEAARGYAQIVAQGTARLAAHLKTLGAPGTP